MIVMNVLWWMADRALGGKRLRTSMDELEERVVDVLGRIHNLSNGRFRARRS